MKGKTALHEQPMMKAGGLGCIINLHLKTFIVLNSVYLIRYFFTRRPYSEGW